MGTPNKCCDQCNIKVVLPARIGGMVKPTKELVVATGKVKGKKAVMTFPLQTGEGYEASAEDVEMNGEVVLSGHDAFHPDVMVRTTKAEIDEMMESMTKEQSKSIFASAWNRIKNINTDVLYAKGGDEWTDFINDFLVYYVARYKLFGKMMPAVYDPAMGKHIKEVGLKNTMFDGKNEIKPDTILTGVKCKKCKKDLPPHTAAEHLDASHKVHLCPHA